jgi:hypothetical protein
MGRCFLDSNERDAIIARIAAIEAELEKLHHSGLPVIERTKKMVDLQIELGPLVRAIADQPPPIP